jgi:integrase
VADVGGPGGRAPSAFDGLGVVDPALAAALDLAAGALAPSTVAAYRSAWRDFAVFAASRGVAALPADRALIVRWLALRADGGRGGGASRLLAAVRAAHIERGFDDPTADAWVKRVAAGAERAAVAVRPARPLRSALPVSVVAASLGAVPAWLGVHGGLVAARSLPDAALLALRDVALMALGLRLMRRASELVALRLADVRDSPDGSVTVSVRRSKTDQLGVGLALPLDAVGGPACPVGLLQRWLAVRPVLASRGPSCDRVFVSVSGGPMSVGAVSSVVRRAAAAAGLDGTYSSHSLRTGGATAAARAGASMATIQAVGGWASDAVRRYVRPAEGDLSARMGFG